MTIGVHWRWKSSPQIEMAYYGVSRALLHLAIYLLVRASVTVAAARHCVTLTSGVVRACSIARVYWTQSPRPSAVFRASQNPAIVYGARKR